MSTAPTFSELERIALAGDAADPAAGPAVASAFVTAVRGLRRLLKSGDDRLVFRAAELLARIWIRPFTVMP